MDKTIRDIYLIYLGMSETIEGLDGNFTDADWWYKGNIIELDNIIKLLDEIK